MRRFTTKYCAIAVLLATFCWAQTQGDAEAKVLAWSNQLITMTNDWLNGKQSSAGITVNLREVGRGNTQKGLAVQYHVYVKGAPTDQTYTQVNWPINASRASDTMLGLTIGKDGIVMCAGRAPEQCGSPNKKDDPVEFTLFPARGEVYRIALVSADQKTKAFFAMVPDPIIGKNKSCTVEVVRVLPHFEAILIRGRGFKPNETVQLTSKSYDESHEGPLHADDQGDVAMGMQPFVKDKERGKTDIKLTGETCSPAVSFEWGKQ